MSKRRKDLGSSEDSFSDDFSPDKVSSKKSSKKKSKTFKSSDDEISESRVESTKPRRRAAKESAFERQLRLAMEQSLREATENLNVDKTPKEKIEEPKVCPLLEAEKKPEVSLVKLSSEEFPQLDWNAKESETEVHKKIRKKDSFDETAEAADDKQAKDSKIPDELKSTNKSDIIDLASPKDKIIKSAEKPKKPTKVLDGSDEDGFGDIISPKEKVNNSAEKPKKSKKPTKALESSEEEYRFGEKGKESSDEDYGSAKKKKDSAKKKTPPKKKKEPTKKKKSILDLTSPLEILEQENKTVTSSDSAKDSAKKRRSILDLKSPLEILEPENKTVTPAKKTNASKKLELKESSAGGISAETERPVESQISPDKENLRPMETKGNDSTTKKLLNMSDKYHEFNNQTLQKIELPKTETHGLLPKHVSKLPSGITANTLTKSTFGTEESKQPANPAFKSVTMGAKLCNAAPIKNNSPAVRVGLSRNHKFPSLHKNVKPLL